MSQHQSQQVLRKKFNQQILTFLTELLEQRHELRSGEVSSEVMDSEAAGSDQKQPDGARAPGVGARVSSLPGDLQPGDKQCDALQSLARVSGRGLGFWSMVVYGLHFQPPFSNFSKTMVLMLQCQHRVTISAAAWMLLTAKCAGD